MINSAFNKWAAAFVFALLGHAAIAFAWSGPIKPQLEKSSGTPVTIVGSLANFVESQEIKEISEITEAVEETSETEVEPLTTEITPIEEPVEELKQALLPAKTEVIREKPKTIKPEPEPARKLKKKTPRKPKKVNKRPPQKKSKASRKQTSLRKGGGARGKKKHRAGTATRANYRGRIQAHLARFKLRLKRGTRGRARVKFSLSKSGRITSLRLVNRSGNSAVDRAAISMVRRAVPFPPIPPGMKNRQGFRIPVIYN